MKIISFFTSLLLISFFTGCTTDADFGDSHWKELTQATAERDAETLLSLSVTADDSLRNQAYRSMVHTPLTKNQIDEIIFRRKNPFRWFSLSMQDVSEEQLKEMRLMLKNEPDNQQQWLSYALGKQADSLSYEILTELLNSYPDHKHRAQLAFSASEILYRHTYPDSLAFQLLPLITSSDFKIQESALYGYYRTLPDKILRNEHWDEVFAQLQSKPDFFSPYARQMLYAIGFFYQPEKMSDIIKDVNLEEELISAQLILMRTINRLDNPELQEDLVLYGLKHENDHIYIAALRSLNGLSGSIQSKGLDLVRAAADQDSSILKKFESIRVLQEITINTDIDRKTYWNHLRDYPLHANLIISILEHNQSAYSFMGQLLNRYRSFPVLTQMSVNEKVLKLYQSLSKPERDNAVDYLQNHVEYLFSEAPADRGIYYTFSPYLTEPYVMNRSLRILISERLLTLDPVADIEVYQSLLPDLFPDVNVSWQQKLVDHLLTEPSPVVRDLLTELSEDSEIEIDIPKLSPDNKPGLHVPNFNRISPHLSDNVALRLTTTKGVIDINLDPYRAPATVSMIDSLSRARLYEGVPFHRVIPDFVAQGGDFERGDGFGGGTEMIPTEPSELSFARGAYGMASAGPDTESSQFFIMHSWKPHLDTRYTNFGMVVRGMDVVDALVKGDTIISAEIIGE